jgi:hypothetical protein
MISPKLLDFSPFFLLVFSPLGTADFLMLLELSGDGYSLLCSKKQPPRHSSVTTTLTRSHKNLLASFHSVAFPLNLQKIWDTILQKVGSRLLSDLLLCTQHGQTKNSCSCQLTFPTSWLANFDWITILNEKCVFSQTEY